MEELAHVVGSRNQPEEIRSVLELVLGQDEAEVRQAGVIGLSERLRNSGRRLRVQINSLDSQAAHRFHALLGRALQIIRNKDAGADQIQRSLRLLENASSEDATGTVLALLDRFPPPAIQIAAIRTLSRLNGPGFEEAVLARWRTVSPETRREILPVLLSRKERAATLLAAIESGRISPGEVEAVSRSALLRHAEPSIRRRAVALWGDDKSGTRNDVIQSYRSALKLRGDVKAGQNVFERLCSSCHRLSGIGNEVGPNLALADTRSPDELLTHILDPNREANPAYVQYNVETADGETYSGLIVADQASGITLKGVNFEKTIARAQVRKMTSEGKSLMPVGLEQGLSSQGMADLLAFLIDSHYDFGTSGHSDSHDVPLR